MKSTSRWILKWFGLFKVFQGQLTRELLCYPLEHKIIVISSCLSIKCANFHQVKIIHSLLANISLRNSLFYKKMVYRLYTK